jgi:hypothetical protein
VRGGMYGSGIRNAPKNYSNKNNSRQSFLCCRCLTLFKTPNISLLIKNWLLKSGHVCSSVKLQTKSEKREKEEQEEAWDATQDIHSLGLYILKIRLWERDRDNTLRERER